MVIDHKEKIRRKKTNYIRFKPEQVGENILNREFSASAPNEKWLTDVTEFKVIGTRQKLYLSSILDLYDNSIVSYEFNLSNNNVLVFKTFDKAIEKNPHAKPIFHSDRGFQYKSKIFKAKLDNKG